MALYVRGRVKTEKDFFSPPREQMNFATVAKTGQWQKTSGRADRGASILSVHQSRLRATLHKSGYIVGDMPSHKVPPSD